MGYKILGFLVWQGAKRYLRRRYADFQRKLAIGAVTALVVVVAAIVFGQRQGSGS
jgi:hypothetical protein